MEIHTAPYELCVKGNTCYTYKATIDLYDANTLLIFLIIIFVILPIILYIIDKITKIITNKQKSISTIDCVINPMLTQNNTNIV